jgi:threonine dehydrogenase-like Zn-dependent dehydrogenase
MMNWAWLSRRRAHGVSCASIVRRTCVGDWSRAIDLEPWHLQALEGMIAADVNGAACICRELHIPYALNAADKDFSEQLSDLTNGDMPTIVIDATGNLNAINNSFQYLAHTGRFVLIGLQRGDIKVNHPEFHKREATLMSSRNATVNDFEYVISCIKEGKLYPASFITSRLKFPQVADQFRNIVTDPTNIKTMIEFHD